MKKKKLIKLINKEIDAKCNERFDGRNTSISITTEDPEIFQHEWQKQHEEYNNALKFDIPTKEEIVLKEKPLSIKDVQVDVSGCSDLEAESIRDIFRFYAKEQDYVLDTISGLVKISFNFSDSERTTLTPQQFKEMFGKDEIPNIRTVQVKVTTEEEAKELADIVVARGEEIWDEDEALKLFLSACYFSPNGIKRWGVFLHSENLKTITIEQFREWYGQPKEIDWSKAGQTLIGKNKEHVLFTTGIHSCDLFEAIVIKGDDWHDKGEFSTNWHKSAFQLCTEPITLQND